MNTLIFVYGTLKRGCENHGWIADQRFITQTRTQAHYRLYDLGGYPGMILSEEGLSIEGELWEVDTEGLARLDLLEDTAGGEYERVPITLEDGTLAETYLYLRSTAGCRDCGECW